MLFKIFSLLSLLLITLLIGCVNEAKSHSNQWQEISGRDDGVSLDRPLLYRACVPGHWERRDPLASESIMDTTKSVCEFYIHDDEHSSFIRLTFHTFPITKTQFRIPPAAQIARWKRQFEELEILTTHVAPESHGGFSGLFFEGQGIIKDVPTHVMGWSMQLASPYDRQLLQVHAPIEQKKCADYTIKASGPPNLMEKHRAEILAFAQSFELIDELPLSL